MKKLRILLVPFLMLAFTSLRAAETEPNNSSVQANTLALNGSITGAINIAGDEDWWKVTTNTDGKLNVTITVSNSLLLRCYIYDNDGITLLNSGYSGTTITVSQDGLAVGTYYIKLVAYYAAQTPVYTVANVLNVPAQVNDVEPNNTRNQAKVLNLNGNKTGHVGYYYNNQRDTADWWKVSTNANGLLHVEVTPANGSIIRVYLYDNDGTTLLNSAYSSSNASLDEDGLATGTYYIKVISYYNYEFEPYTITNTFTEPAQANDAEPNNNREQASVLPQDASKTGHVGYYYNLERDTADWYKVTTNADGMLRVSATPANGSIIRVYLYDNDGTTLLNSAYSSTNASLNEDGLAAGTYYIKVVSYYNYEFEPYTITNALTEPAQANDAEPNDSRVQASVLPQDASKTGHVGYYYNVKRDTADWYKVTTNADGMLRVSATPANGSIIRLYLYDNDGTTILNSAYSSTKATVEQDGLAKGAYYLKVISYYNYQFEPYTISDSLYTYNNIADNEPNNSAYLAQTLTANTANPGHIGFYYDNIRDTFDWYKINYTGANNGSMAVTLNLETPKLSGNYIVYLTIYKDTNATALYNQYSAAASITANLTSLTQGYYWVKIRCYYNYQFQPYSITPTFNQVNVASVNLVNATAVNSCDLSNTVRLQCGGSNAPYKVQLLRFGVLYSTTTVNTTAAFDITGLPTGYYSAKVYGDGASGNAYGTSAGAQLEPRPANLVTSNIQSTQAKITWDGYAGCVLGYRLQYKEQSASEWITKYLFNTSTTLKGLTPGTAYQWRVASGDSANGFIALSPNSTMATFTTAATFAAATIGTSESLSKANGNTGVTVYPNPVRNAFTIQLGQFAANEKVSATLRNMNGNIVWNKSNIVAAALNNTRVDASGFTAGIYLLQVIDHHNNKTINTKVVIAR
jgi:hypothetical protein